MGEIKSSGRPIDQLFEKVLSINIVSSDYYRDLLRLNTYNEVIDEIYVTVTHVEPWMTGNCRGPSTAYCLLYKFFTMKLTVKQMHGLLQHPDSPYIRAIGFLYLRYVADPKTLWSWYEPYIKDDEEFSPGSNGRTTSMGAYLRDLLLGQYYFDTLFPRIPVLVIRSIVANLENLKLPTKHCGVTGETTRGADDTVRRPPSVKASLSVSFGQRAPHRASTRGSSPVRRDLPDRESVRDRDRDRERERDRERDRDRDLERDRDRYRDRRSRDSYRRNYDRSERREGGSRRSRSRSRSRSGSIYESGHDENRGGSSNNNASTSSNLAKLKDLYGDSSNGEKKDRGDEKVYSRPGGTEEVIRLGGSTWR